MKELKINGVFDLSDEEKAEEYIDNLDLIKERNPELKTNDDFIKQAHLDGLAEGRKEKWHDLRKDPNDLPKHKNSSVNRICWINAYGNKCYHDAFYDDKGFYWVSEKTCTKHYPVINVIAWTELPNFEE